MSERSLCGLVLAGGRSSRMGVDKASMTHPDGRTLAKRAVDLLSNAGCGEVFVSLRADQEIPVGFPEEPKLIRDSDESRGPLSGILSAMAERPDSDWLVVACDLPRLDESTLKNLLMSVGEKEVFLAYKSEFDGLPEPLCTWYSAAAREILIAAESPCPRKILLRNGCRLLEPVQSGALDNANTPEEWSASTK